MQSNTSDTSLPEFSDKEAQDALSAAMKQWLEFPDQKPQDAPSAVKQWLEYCDKKPHDALSTVKKWLVKLTGVDLKSRDGLERQNEPESQDQTTFNRTVKQPVFKELRRIQDDLHKGMNTWSDDGSVFDRDMAKNRLHWFKIQISQTIHLKEYWLEQLDEELRASYCNPLRSLDIPTKDDIIEGEAQLRYAQEGVQGLMLRGQTQPDKASDSQNQAEPKV